MSTLDGDAVALIAGTDLLARATSAPATARPARQETVEPSCDQQRYASYDNPDRNVAQHDDPFLADAGTDQNADLIHTCGQHIGERC